MTVGERIRYFRKLNKLTQEELGLKLGYNKKTAGIRIFQYEVGRRVPKQEALKRFADIFGVSVYVFETPNIDNEIMLLHTLFTLEEVRGIDLIDDGEEISFHFDKDKQNNADLFEHLHAWKEMKRKHENGEISKAEYDRWKNSYSISINK